MSPLAAAARLAWRETRGAWRQFGGLVACVALGVAALVGVDSFGASLDHTLGREARILMGGDLELRAAHVLGADAEAAVAALTKRGARVTRLRELVAMARSPRTGRTGLVELKAVDDAYPLYGQVDADPARGTRPAPAPGEALVQAGLLERLGLAVGDDLDLGDARFTVVGVIRHEPDRPAGLFALGPRVLVSQQGLVRTKLVQPGSRVRYRVLVRMPEGADAAETRRDLAPLLTDPGLRVATHDDAQPGLRRFLGQLTTYLGLMGLTSLLVGGIGVASSTRTFVRRKLTTIAVLKCLGAGSRTLLLAYGLQALALGALGSLLGIALGRVVASLVGPALAVFVPFTVVPALGAGPILRGLVMGVGVTLLCAAWPLLGVQAVPPALVLRHVVEPPARPDRRWAVAAGIAAGLGGLVLWQARSVMVGALFAGAALAALLLLALCAAMAPRLILGLPRAPWLAWRQGLAGLGRPGGEARGVAVALGIGVMLLSAVALVERALGDQLDLERQREAPSFFFVDLQPDQLDAFGAALAGAAPEARPTLTPVVRGRLVAIGERPVTRQLWEGREDAWRFTREYVLTYAAALPAGNVVTRGAWWDGRGTASPRVSVEEETARALGAGVGDRLTFDIQGARVEAEVASIRHVDWQTLSTNFFVIFAPGTLEAAPLTYVATTRVPRDREAAVQDRIAQALPNVTAIPLRDLLERVVGVLDRIALAVRLVAGFVVLAGLVVMAGALATSRAQRLYESVILRTLGATRGVVARAFAVEYGCLGLVAGVSGTALGALLAWAVLYFVLAVPFRPAPGPLLASLALSVILALAVGGLGTFRLLGRPPLAVLRGE